MFEAVGNEEEGIAWGDVLGEEGALWEDVCAKDEVRQLRGFLDSVLEERERKVLGLRFGLLGEEPLPQREVARRCLLSRSYVSDRGYGK